jgi:hypothetical protein
LTGDRWKKNVMRSFRLSPALLESIQAECQTRKLSLSEYVRQASTVYIKHGRIAQEHAQKPQEEQQQWSPELYQRLQRRR